jgi:uncharacterized protein GlcG (DUF336 family)
MIRSAAAVFAFVLFASPGFAADVVTVHRLSATLAGEAVMAAVVTCAQQGYSVTAVVVDTDGVQQATLRGDTASIHTMEAAFDKAYTSVTSRVDTMALVERQKAGTLPPVLLRPLEHMLVGQGGLVIKVHDEVVSGIGVSGSPGGDKDEACARAGLDRIRSRLN